MQVERDPKKAAANLRKHGVSLDEGAGSLLDPLALVREDASAQGEARFVLVGISARGRLLTVCYAPAGRGNDRLISARRATAKEKPQYATGI